MSAIRFIIVFSWFVSVNLYSQNEFVDSLKQALNTASHDTSRCYILSQLVDNTDEKEWPAFNEQMGEIAKKNLVSIKPGSDLHKYYSKYLSGSYTNLGYLAHSKGNLISAIDYYEKALKITQSISDAASEAGIINNIGFIYMDQGDIPKALDFFGKCLGIFEKLGDKKGIGGALNNIGYIYDMQGDKIKARDYYEKCLKIREEISDKSGTGVSLNNLGVMYKEEGNLSKALEYLLKSLKIREEGLDKSAIASTLNNIGGLYCEQGDAIKALTFHERSLKLHEEIGDKNGASGTFVFLGNAYVELKMYDKAIVAGKKAVEIATQIGFPEKIKHAAFLLMNVYELKGDYNNALRNYELYVLMRDSIKNEETQKATIRSQFRIEYDKKEQEAKAEQEKKDLKNEEEKQKQIIIRNTFIGGFALVLLLALVIYRSFLQNKRKNKLIEAQKTLVEEKQKEIVDSIQYARRIQTALMPSEIYLTKAMSRLRK
ncbi:MAG: tetratricopeptide repeat protein [Sphingobacteriaceae bacterium]|nr:tetratricopeptide repeat protein [Sphingobacteriaceae bacterium]